MYNICLLICLYQILAHFLTKLHNNIFRFTDLTMFTCSVLKICSFTFSEAENFPCNYKLRLLYSKRKKTYMLKAASR